MSEQSKHEIRPARFGASEVLKPSPDGQGELTVALFMDTHPWDGVESATRARAYVDAEAELARLRRVEEAARVWVEHTDNARRSTSMKAVKDGKAKLDALRAALNGEDR